MAAREQLNMRWGRRAVVTISLASLLGAAPASKPVAPATRATTPATTRGAGTVPRRGGPSDAGAAAVRAAVQTLTKEHEQFLRGAGGGTGVREESNFFKENPDPAVTPDAIVAALTSRGGGDPRTSSYVKWQLLSGLPEDGDELAPTAAKQLLAAYRAAPQPVMRPGVSQQ